MKFKLNAFIFLFMATNVFAQTLSIQNLKLPPGFNIELFAYPVPDARQMTLGDKDTVFVGTRSGDVYAITNASIANKRKIIKIASHLNAPNGVAFKNGSLYVAEIQRILRYDHIEDHLASPPQPDSLAVTLPTETHHGWRYIAFGPDQKLYVSIGMPCNVCLEKNPVFGTIIRMDKNGKKLEIYAKGIRNSVGFDWDKNHSLWFTDNGRDWLGDNVPPDEINHAPKPTMHFGFPYYDGNIENKTYRNEKPNIVFTFPITNLPAHVAALGIKFYRGTMFPKEYQQTVFIAEHGSWNRTTKDGYQIISATLEGDHLSNIKPFITGWLQDQKTLGRPVDVLMLKDGSMLISDDYAGAIYRVTYRR